MMDGFFQIHRQIFDSWIFADDKALKIFIWLIGKARHKDGIVPLKIGKGVQTINLKKGQLIFGRHKAEEELFYNGSLIYRKLQKLESDGTILIESNNQYSIITVCKYEEYQFLDKKTNNQCTGNTQPTNNERTSNEQASNTNNTVNTVNTVKKVKEVKIIPTASSDADNFYLTCKKKKLKGKRLETFLIFWEKFNYKKSKSEAAQAWLEIPTLNTSLCSKIFSAAEAEAKNRPNLRANKITPKMAQGWLTAKRWEDESESVLNKKVFTIKPQRKQDYE